MAGDSPTVGNNPSNDALEEYKRRQSAASIDDTDSDEVLAASKGKTSTESLSGKQGQVPEADRESLSYSFSGMGRSAMEARTGGLDPTNLLANNDRQGQAGIEDWTKTKWDGSSAANDTGSASSGAYLPGALPQTEEQIALALANYDPETGLNSNLTKSALHKSGDTYVHCYDDKCMPGKEAVVDGKEVIDFGDKGTISKSAYDTAEKLYEASLAEAKPEAEETSTDKKPNTVDEAEKKEAEAKTPAGEKPKEEIPNSEDSPKPAETENEAETQALEETDETRAEEDSNELEAQAENPVKPDTEDETIDKEGPDKVLEKQKAELEKIDQLKNNSVKGFTRLNTAQGSKDFEMLRALGLSEKQISAEHNNYYMKDNENGTKTLIYDGSFDGEEESHMAKITFDDYKDDDGSNLKLGERGDWQFLNDEDKSIVKEFIDINIKLDEAFDGDRSKRHEYTNALASAENFLKNNADKTGVMEALKSTSMDKVSTAQLTEKVEAAYEADVDTAMKRALGEISGMKDLLIDKASNDDAHDNLTKLANNLTDSLYAKDNGAAKRKLLKELGLNENSSGKEVDDALQNKISEEIKKQNYDQRLLNDDQLKSYNESKKALNETLGKLKDQALKNKLSELSSKLTSKEKQRSEEMGQGDKSITGMERDKLNKIKQVADKALAKQVATERAQQQQNQPDTTDDRDDSDGPDDLQQQHDRPNAPDPSTNFMNDLEPDRPDTTTRPDPSTNFMQDLEPDNPNSDPNFRPKFKPGSVEDVKKAVQHFLDQGKSSVKLQFSTSWCGHCRKPEAENEAAFKRGEAVLYIDGDKFGSLREKFGVNSYPSFRTVSSAGDLE